MVFKAKPGYEDLYDAVIAKQAKLDAEKASKTDEAIKAIEDEFAERTKDLANFFTAVSEIDDTVIEEAPEPEEGSVNPDVTTEANPI